jgi:hypothetical protein
MFDFTVEQAGDELTGFDLIAIRHTFGADISELGSVALTAITWALLNKDKNAPVSASDVKKMRLRELSAHYVTLPDPLVTVGKDEMPVS